MKRARAGFTLLEVLLAVALLAAVVTGSGWWIRESIRRARSTGELLIREASAQALLDAIERDLLRGDLALPASFGPKVKAAAGGLAVATRSASGGGGAILREYVFRPSTGELLATERALDLGAASGTAPGPRVVLGGVRWFAATRDERTRSLLVEIELENERATTCSRRWGLP